MQTAQQPRVSSPLAALGLRLPEARTGAVAWGPWQVIDRAKGYHVARETAGGSRTEALTNEVGATRVFRKRALAERAAASANFAQQAVALADEPLLGGKGGAA